MTMYRGSAAIITSIVMGHDDDKNKKENILHNNEKIDVSSCRCLHCQSQCYQLIIQWTYQYVTKNNLNF